MSSSFLGGRSDFDANRKTMILYLSNAHSIELFGLMVIFNCGWDMDLCGTYLIFESLSFICCSWNELVNLHYNEQGWLISYVAF